MRSADVMAIAAVGLGAAMAFSLTALAVQWPASARATPLEMTRSELAPIAWCECPLVSVELMVGPEGLHSGWSPPPVPRAP